MSSDTFYDSPTFAFEAAPTERAMFIRRTYTHLAGAIAAFACTTALILSLPGIENLVIGMTQGWMWLIVLGAFMAVSFVAHKWAESDTSIQTQYFGLGLYVLAEAVIFTPLLFVATRFCSPDVLPIAAITTLGLFGGLTAVVFTTRSDFSFLGPILWVSGFVLLAVIAAGVIFGFNLGLAFGGLLVVFAGASILYDTSNVLHHYRTDQHVAASLALFSSVALLFYYILWILIQMNSND